MQFENKIIYQIYPKSFKDSNGDGYGDLAGIIEKLPYLKKLGVDYLWLSPINKSPQNDNGYDISDYYEIDTIFGTKDEYLNLIKQAKKLGLKIMMDLVLNHISTEHKWFKLALQGQRQYQEYFIFREQPNELQSAFGTNAWTYVPELKKYYLHLFDKTQADLNWDNPQVKAEIYRMINYWLDLGIEGFRLDVIDLIGKEPDKLITAKGPKFLKNLQELTNNTFQDKVLTVGECWNSSIQDAYQMTNHGLSQVFHFFHINWIYPKWEAKKITLTQIAQIINTWQNDYQGVEALVQNNHDLPRYISYMFGQSMDYHYEKAILLLMINLMLKGNLYLYQGEEIGMSNNYQTTLVDYIDVETQNKIQELQQLGKNQTEILQLMQRISRDNARSPMQWTSDEYAGFSEVKPWLLVNDNYKQVNVEQDQKSVKSIYYTYQKLLKLRKQNYQLIKDSSYQCQVIEETGLIIKTEKFKVLLNFSNKPLTCKIEDVDVKIKNTKILFSNYQTKIFMNKLQPYEGIILVTEGE
ncbi:MAG: alpha-amylase family glycosyl hydrolase [Mycoplasmatales bacterium]